MNLNSLWFSPTGDCGGHGNDKDQTAKAPHNHYKTCHKTSATRRHLKENKIIDRKHDASPDGVRRCCWGVASYHLSSRYLICLTLSRSVILACWLNHQWEAPTPSSARTWTTNHVSAALCKEASFLFQCIWQENVPWAEWQKYKPAALLLFFQQ